MNLNNLFNQENSDNYRRKREKSQTCEALMESFKATMKAGVEQNTMGLPISESAWEELRQRAYIFASEYEVDKQIIHKWLDELAKSVKDKWSFYRIVESLPNRI